MTRPPDIHQLVDALSALADRMEAPLSDEDRRSNWREDARESWSAYVQELRDACRSLEQGGKEWSTEDAGRFRVRHIARGLNNDGLIVGERVGEMVTAQRLLTRVYPELR
jgi:hypothetical protein